MRKKNRGGEEAVGESRPEPCCGERTMPRRQFLAVSGLAISGAFEGRPVMAGPFETAGPSETAEFSRLIPPDKKLHSRWVHSLYARGGSSRYTKARGELQHIGMPVGGLFAGTLYLGGDGKLWLWDIFNENKNGILSRSIHWDGFGAARDIRTQDGANYVDPAPPSSPLEQGFAVRIDGAVRRLDSSGWSNIEFTGEYPIGTVRYSDPACPAAVTMTAYSPFIPLNADDSSIPAVICEITIHNQGAGRMAVDAAGWLQNACSLFSAGPNSGIRTNRVVSRPESTAVESRFQIGGVPAGGQARPDIVVDDFQHEGYGGWKVEGLAFGAGPVERSAVPSYQGDLGGPGTRVVNSHAAAPGATVEERDSRTGMLTSPPFVLERDFLTFYIGGGANIDEVGLRLLVDGKAVRRAAGRNENRMHRESFDVRDLMGRQAVIQIYDNATGGWGNIGVDAIVQTDQPAGEPLSETDHDFGTMALALIDDGGGGPGLRAHSDVTPAALFDAAPTDEARKPAGQPLIGGIVKEQSLGPVETMTARFVIAWHFPNNKLRVPGAETGNAYAARFPDAGAVAATVAREYSRLSSQTKLWHDTWYDSTLPHWFLDRTFINTSILATSTAHRFASGRFWAWEGIGCCEGTCTHVWHYAQAVGRIFPEIERHTREFVDFGTAFDAANGVIGYRGEGTGPAVDGQCGRILGAYREHQMSVDDAFLRRIWPRVRGAMEWLIHHDTDGDGLLDGAQENTLDAAWYGKIAWISSLYAAALRACEAMARDIGDEPFAGLCHEKALVSSQAIETQLFNGEYFIQRPDPAHPKSLGTYQTCHIDQVHGQSWAWQVHLGRILDREKTLSALRSLYRYNFVMDVGPFRRKNQPGRAYALAGDAGLIMATNPRDLPEAFGNVSDWQYGYFNECMSGFEHQAASHLIAEGLVLEGLAVTRAIHDRYHPSRRNPYNEIECSDHYSRAMASYGSFISACGFEYHGSKAHIGFDPRLSPENFRVAFTAAEGWGTFSQKRSGETLRADMRLRYGRLALSTIALAGEYRQVSARVGRTEAAAHVTSSAGRCIITLNPQVQLQAGQALSLTLA